MYQKHNKKLTNNIEENVLYVFKIYLIHAVFFILVKELITIKFEKYSKINLTMWVEEKEMEEKILIIEDEPDIQNILRYSFYERGI